MVRLVPLLSGVKNSRRKRIKQAPVGDSYTRPNSPLNLTLVGIIAFVTIGAASISFLSEHGDIANIMLLPSNEWPNKLLSASSSEYVIQKPEVCLFV